jgi:hypothetical protein
MFGDTAGRGLPSAGRHAPEVRCAWRGHAGVQGEPAHGCARSRAKGGRGRKNRRRSKTRGPARRVGGRAARHRGRGCPGQGVRPRQPPRGRTRAVGPMGASLTRGAQPKVHSSRVRGRRSGAGCITSQIYMCVRASKGRRRTGWQLQPGGRGRGLGRCGPWECERPVKPPAAGAVAGAGAPACSRGTQWRGACGGAPLVPLESGRSPGGRPSQDDFLDRGRAWHARRARQQGGLHPAPEAAVGRPGPEGPQGSLSVGCRGSQTCGRGPRGGRPSAQGGR